VVIDNLDVIGITIAPRKADAPAVIDPNAILSRSIPCQLFRLRTRSAVQETVSPQDAVMVSAAAQAHACYVIRTFSS
jgi:hypothetical protein